MDQANIIKEGPKQFSRSVININEAPESNELRSTEIHQNNYQSKADMPKIGTSEQNNDQATFQELGFGKAYYIELLVKSIVVILGTIAIVAGIITCITLKVQCLSAGILLSLNGLLIIAFEVPILFSFVKFINPIREFSNARKPIEKIFIYIVPAMIVIILCQNFSAIIGTLSIFGASGIYVFAYLV